MKLKETGIEVRIEVILVQRIEEENQATRRNQGIIHHTVCLLTGLPRFIFFPSCTCVAVLLSATILHF
ncbi:hypothetical protein POPTR_010G218001v4 [Populus trichocarpa]|uniref:Uncharacterized protein n=1 Tax=Populus trichocarpa TaxID=3694 RepID=A0ACC0SEU6_POPTR|nr:hypothetical protein POPTR_010G218001v4 [Populus trichocarpa]